jgi:hypothetical protein
MSDASPTLDKAYGLIEKGQLSEARTLLDSLMPEHENNPDVWWLMANAAEDSNEGRLALDKVIALNPDYPGAKDLLKEATQNTSDQPTNKDNKQSKIPTQLLALIILLLVGIGVILFLLLNSNTTPPQVADNPTVTNGVDGSLVDVSETPFDVSATSIDVVPFDDITATNDGAGGGDATPITETNETIEPTPTPEVLEETPTNEQGLDATPTNEEPIIEFTAQNVPDSSPAPENPISENSLAFLDAFNTPDNGVSLENSTLKVALCAIVGTEAGNAIRDLILSIATNNTSIDVSVNMVEISIVDCFDTGNEQRAVSVPMDSIRAYANNVIDLQTLQQAILPIR